MKPVIPSFCYDKEIRNLDVELECHSVDCLLQHKALYVLPKNSIIYTGSRVQNPHYLYSLSSIPLYYQDVFKYKGMNKELLTDVEHYVSYFSSDITTAKGYAINSDAGWINKFVTTQDIYFYRLETFADVEEVDRCICKFPYIIEDVHISGLCVLYSDNDDKNEFAICNPWTYMNYVGTTVITTKGEFEKFKPLFMLTY